MRVLLRFFQVCGLFPHNAFVRVLVAKGVLDEKL